MAQFEEVYAGLAVAREVCRDEAQMIATELDRLNSLGGESLWPFCMGGFSVLGQELLTIGGVPENPEIIYLARLATELAAAPFFEQRSNMSFNRYDPFSGGITHEDDDFSSPVFVVGMTDVDDDSFEYYHKTGEGPMVDQLADSPKTLRLEAGDVLKITDTTLSHRGINPASKFRYSAVFFSGL